MLTPIPLPRPRESGRSSRSDSRSGRLRYRLRRSLLVPACLLLAACAREESAPADRATAVPAPAAVVAPASGERARLEARARRVEILRDDYGVPHIYAKTDADAVFGLLYAQAEDDFPRVERNYYWAIGRLAEAEGEDALFSDLRARLYMTTEEAVAAYEAAPDWLRELCDAFADGLNYYLATHPEVQPKVIERFEPWMPMFFFEGSIGGDIEQIPLDGIRAFYGGGAPDRAVASLSLTTSGDEPRGSNGFAISGELTRSGDAMLLINPHTSFYFRGEVHVVSEEGLNAYGAVTWGQFFVYQGFNEDTGWMHTSTYVDFIDEFVEDVVEKDGELVYRYGEELRPVEVGEVTLRYRDGDSYSERSFPTYRTHHGPITHSVDGKWVATKINWDPVNALRQSFVRTKQDGFEGFNEMMQIRTNSSNNTVYADSSGNIAYYHGNFVPKRDTSFDFSGPVDGSNPATDWQGLHELDEIITLLNPENGWIQNCNSTPFSAAGDYSPVAADYPVYMAPEAENFRGVHAVRLLQDAGDLTLDSLIDLAYDPALPAFEVLIPGLIAAFDANAAQYPGLAPAIDVLRDWDFRVSKDSVAMTLAHFYGLTYGEQGEAPDAMSGMERLTYFGTASPPEERLRVFADTVAALEADYGSWNMPWGEVNRFQRLTGDIRQPHDDAAPSLPVGLASGRWGSLAAYGSRRYPETQKLYGYRGNSFVAVVEFGDKVRARTLLAGGQSGDPESRHFDDQARRYVDGEFKDVAYYREDVERRAERRYRPGE
ncbi:MAG: acylase [Halieaceae bacterium]|jgi:acyl-homoserine lactone acylase PvdQ|nr:acylase [Halieaceae bacterium]